MRWRDANVPTKKVHITEFGWDAPQGALGCANFRCIIMLTQPRQVASGVTCSATQCVPEFAQAVYGVRGFLVLNREHVDVANWYFYGDSK